MATQTHVFVTNAMNEFARSIMKKKGVSFNHDKATSFIQLQNHLSKLIRPTPRKVSKSKSFQVSTKNLGGLAALTLAIENGEDINKYLSKQIKNGDIADGFLDHFGCRHFHLGTKLKGRFIERTGEIALAFVNNDEVFFIEAKLHGQSNPLLWYEKSVLEILHSERPDLIADLKMNRNGEPAIETLDSSTLKKLRDHHINVILPLADGTSYMPINSGQSAAGFAVQHTETLCNQANIIAKRIDDDLEKFKEQYNIKKIEIIEINNLEAKDLTHVNYFVLRINAIGDNSINTYGIEYGSK